MPPLTSNHGYHLHKMEAVTVDRKGFHIVPLLTSYRIGEIYTILFKIVSLDHFRPFNVKSDERDRWTLEAGTTCGINQGVQKYIILKIF